LRLSVTILFVNKVSSYFTFARIRFETVFKTPEVFKILEI
jgi:hypothetical protein